MNALQHVAGAHTASFFDVRRHRAKVGHCRRSDRRISRLVVLMIAAVTSVLIAIAVGLLPDNRADGNPGANASAQTIKANIETLKRSHAWWTSYGQRGSRPQDRAKDRIAKAD